MYIENSWKNEINCKSSLKYLNQDILSVGKPHPIWASVRYNIQDRKRAELKVKLLAGSYALQANRANFNQFTVNSTCKLSNAGPEDREHFLARCTFLESIRYHYRQKLSDFISTCTTEKTKLNDSKFFTQFVLDYTASSVQSLYKDGLHNTELWSREYIHKLHYYNTRNLERKLEIHIL